MAETKIIETQTLVTIVGSAISIKAYYETGVSSGNTLLAFISDIVQTVDGVGFIEGELGITMENYPTAIDYEIDNDGNLIVIADDAEHYSIDSSGSLIYTE